MNEAALPDLKVLLLSLVYSACVFGVWIAVLVYGIAKWSRVRPFLLTGLLVGAAIFLGKAPSMVLAGFYVDPTSLLPPGTDEWQQVFVQAMLWVGIVLGWVLAIVGAAHVALQFAAGQTAAEPRSAYPTLLGDPARRFRGWIPGAAIGVTAGVISVLLFWGLGVELGEVVRVARKLLPGIEDASQLLIGAIQLPAFVAIAAAEEILFRGVIQGWITRLLGGGRGAVIVAVVVASAVWTLGHAGTAEPLWLKLTQIFLLGLIFGWLARRYSVESAIVAHVGLNVIALIGGYAIGLGG